MLEVGCKSVPAGDTVRSLAKAYVVNTTCVRQHEITLEGIKEYYKQQKQLHKSE